MLLRLRLGSGYCLKVQARWAEMPRSCSKCVNRPVIAKLFVCATLVDADSKVVYLVDATNPISRGKGFREITYFSAYARAILVVRTAFTGTFEVVRWAVEKALPQAHPP